MVNLNRREFLKGAAGLGAGVAIADLTFNRDSFTRSLLEKIGLLKRGEKSIQYSKLEEKLDYEAQTDPEKVFAEHFAVIDLALSYILSKHDLKGMKQYSEMFSDGRNLSVRIVPESMDTLSPNGSKFFTAYIRVQSPDKENTYMLTLRDNVTNDFEAMGWNGFALSHYASQCKTKLDEISETVQRKMPARVEGGYIREQIERNLKRHVENTTFLEPCDDKLEGKVAYAKYDREKHLGSERHTTTMNGLDYGKYNDLLTKILEAYGGYHRPSYEIFSIDPRQRGIVSRIFSIEGKPFNVVHK